RGQGLSGRRADAVGGGEQGGGGLAQVDGVDGEIGVHRQPPGGERDAPRLGKFGRPRGSLWTSCAQAWGGPKTDRVCFVIVAVGIDVVLVDRFARALQRTTLLADRLFNGSER